MRVSIERAILDRIDPAPAIAARVLGSCSLGIRAVMISLPDTPKMSLATTDGLIWAPSSRFSTRYAAGSLDGRLRFLDLCAVRRG